MYAGVFVITFDQLAVRTDLHYRILYAHNPYMYKKNWYIHVSACVGVGMVLVSMNMSLCII